jgi:hypothetical protein
MRDTPGPLLALVCSLIVCGCSSSHRTFHFSGGDMKNAFESWRSKAPATDQQKIAALERDETTIIHIIRGQLDPSLSRGSAAYKAADPDARKRCVLHPAADGIRSMRNWDVVYDQRVAEKPHGFPNPVEALLHHEILGHIEKVLMDRSWADRSIAETEAYALERENEYRRHNGLQLAPHSFPSAPSKSP